MINYILLIGTLLGLTSVCAGAYIDHVLVHAVDVKTLSLIKTALHYNELYAVIISVIVCIPLGTNAFSSMKSNTDSCVIRTLNPVLREQ